jgi:hypothetical protein
VTMTEEATDNSPGTPLTQISSNDIISVGSHRALVRWIGLSAAVAAAVLTVVVLRQRPQLAPLVNETAELAAAGRAPAATPVPLPVLSVEPAVETPSTTTSPVVEALASSATTSSRKGNKKGAAAANKKVDCTPPYVVDENHIRRIKPQCL